MIAKPIENDKFLCLAKFKNGQKKYHNNIEWKRSIQDLSHSLSPLIRQEVSKEDMIGR